MDGVLIIDKPEGITSHDVVGRVRHILHERRIGHSGTLDPFATGVLVVLVGRATRLAQFLTTSEKEYEAVIRLGFSTDTGDRTGNPIDQAELSTRNWTDDEVQKALLSLTGDIEQVPPMYSAKKRQGRKLYELARRGESVHRDPIKVCIHEFHAIRTDAGMIKNNRDGTFDLAARVVCSAGTYVRVLAEDVGKRLGVGAHLAELRRTRVGPFHLTHAISLADLKVRFAEEALGTLLVPPSTALSHMPLLHLSDQDERRARHGMEVSAERTDWTDGTQVRMCNKDDELIAIGEFDAKENRLHPHVVLAVAD
ncbi:MAG TPA: tRNA pseudouridine(55) synthase TruB [Pyrinomonadaceae bacterium]|nr:tRNA pseudouridine(55) synthase TruB [Pyrinomonadaceae bacterium]